MKNVKMFVLAFLAMAFSAVAVPAMAADQAKQQPQVQRVSDSQNRAKNNPYLKKYFDDLACASKDCGKSKPKVKASSFSEMRKFMQR
jgi:hypothetical protein